MTKITGPKDEELEGVYAGIAPSESLADVASFMVEVKSTLTGGPSDATARGHLSAIAAEARKVSATRPLPANQEVFAAGPTTWRKFMDKMIATLAKGAAGVLAASMSMMGLAYAGVDLPGQSAERALEAVTGVTLPNQGDEATSVDDAVRAVVESDADKGCEFGQAVAAAASQNAKGARDGDSEACSAEGDSEAKGSRATGTEKSAKGRATAAEKSAAGKAAATTNSGGRSDAGADNAATGEAEAAERSEGAADSGAGNASEGESTAGENSGGASEGGRPEGAGDAGDAGDDEAAGGPSNADAGSDAAPDAGAPEEIPSGRP